MSTTNTIHINTDGPNPPTEIQIIIRCDAHGDDKNPKPARSAERRVGKSVKLGGRRHKKKTKGITT